MAVRSWVISQKTGLTPTRFTTKTPKNMGRSGVTEAASWMMPSHLTRSFFGYYPAEASRIDPQQRLALEASVHALQDSGTPLEQVAGTRTSVFLGTFMYDHFAIQTATGQRDNVSPHVAMGSSICATANRVSHRLNLQGPSITLDTACSSSLTSLHLACQSLWPQECEGALAGGVNLIFRPETSILMTKAGFLSPDGSCKPFDASANGYVRSEGVGIVYLKPLSRALQDKDRIYACIRGSLVNQDGYTDGFTVPSLGAQTRLLETVYAQSSIDPKMVQYVEAHGPGTPVGDPIEANALGMQLGQGRHEMEESLWIGSVKGNFGHLEGAAGVIGFIKAALITFHGEIPPQANHKTPNPSIDFKSLRLAVPEKRIQLHHSRKRLTGVNSFGAGGTNAHVILEQAPDDICMRTKQAHRMARTFVLSAKSQPALAQTAKDLAAHLRLERPSLEDIAYTLNMRRDRHMQISVVPANSLENLCQRLDQLGSGQPSKETLALQKLSSISSKVSFLFSGQGGQWLGMGMRLAYHEPVFRNNLVIFDDIFTSLAHFSIVAEIFGHSNDPARLSKTIIAQPAIPAIQIALAKTLMSYGLVPDSCVGHSIGEIAAAHISGALTLEEAVSVIYFRSHIQEKAAGAGSMLATGVSGTEAGKLIQRFQVSVEIAAFNGPKMTTLTGKTAELEQLARELEDRGIFARFVKVDTPYHSQFMDPLEDELVTSLSPIQGKQAESKLYSTVTASVESGTHLTGEYWFKNIRCSVRYTETITKMIEDGSGFLVEIGPHPVLISGTRDTAMEIAKRPVHIFPAMARGSDVEPLSCIIGAAHAVGIPVDLSSFNGGGGRLIDLPLYPFQRQPFWFENPECQQARLAESRHPFLEGLTNLADDGRGLLRLRMSTGVSPFLGDHVVDGTIVFPMTGHIEAAYLAASKYLVHQRVWLEDLQFEHPVVLASAEDFAPQAMLELISPANDFVLCTRQANASPTTPWQICSRGRINARDQPPKTHPEALESVKNRLQSGAEVNVDGFYQRLEAAGLRYGEAFKSVRNLWRLGEEVLSIVELPSSLNEEATRFNFHPALLDACVHTMFAYQQYVGDSSHVYLPSRAGTVVLLNDCSVTAAFTHIQVHRHDDLYLMCDASIYGEGGQVLAIFTGLTAKRLQGKSLSRQVEHQVYFHPETEQENKTEAEVENVLIQHPLPGQPEWLEPAIRRTFPSSHVHNKGPEAVAASWEASQWGFNLDRRTLLIIPALSSGPPETCINEGVNAVIRTIIRVASWVHGQTGTCMVVVLTEGGCMTPVDTQCNPVASSLEAATRVMANELPYSLIRVVDLALGTTDGKIPLLEEELRTIRLKRHETVVALRQEGCFVRRIVAVDVEQEKNMSQRLLPVRGGKYQAEPDPSASLNGVVFRQQYSPKIGPDEVGIEVHAAGLNFKDVLNAMGLLGDRAASGGLTGQNLGLEVAGRVTEIGQNVTGIECGAPVMARVPNGIAGYAVASRHLTIPIPSSLSLTQAACMQITYITAYYALATLAQLTSGEKVLIHSGAGGVGIAAIQIAKLVGAQVYATAGSPSRRAWVSSMGVEAVFDSRSLTFHDEIKLATGGQGVDVVLNCLTGSMLSQSVACLAPFGRFLEIGKKDIYRNMRLGLEQFGENCSFFAIDIDRLAIQKPALHRRVVDEVCGLFNDGKLMPPPITTHSVTALPTALKELSRSSVIGKVAVEMLDGDSIQAMLPKQLKLNEDRSYLITGGTSGLGVHLAKFLVDRGAKHLVLVSRSGPKSAEDHAILSSMQRKGTTISIETGDISNAETVHSIFHHQSRPTIAGVIHSAGILEAASSHDVTMDSFQAVYGPKARGAWNLHQATQGLNLDFFVLISSVGSLLAVSGQLSYAAANQFLDGLAHHRQASGLPGLSLNLGFLGDYAGMSRHTPEGNRLLGLAQSEGLSGMSLPEVLSALEHALIHNTTQRMAAHMDWSMFLKAYPHLALDGAYRDLKQTKAESGESNRFPSQLSGPERVQAITDILQSGLARILGVDTNQISPTEKIDQYSLDSMTLTQVRSLILREIQIPYPLIRLFQGPSLLEIAGDLDGTSHSDKPTPGATDTVNDQSELMPYDGLIRLSSPWFVRGNPVNDGCPRVLCFHSMGVGASLFTPFLMDPPDGLDPIAVQLPGRETRTDESSAVSVSEVVSHVMEEMENVVGIPHIFWGHSFGGIIAFEVLRALRRQGKPLPRLFVTGTIAPHRISTWQKRDILIESFQEDISPEYLLAVARYVDNPDLVRSILPMMRQDAPLLLKYQFKEEEPLDIAITGVAAHQDDVVYPEEVTAWQIHSKNFRLIEVDGDHWFLHRNRRLLRETLAALAKE